MSEREEQPVEDGYGLTHVPRQVNCSNHASKRFACVSKAGVHAVGVRMSGPLHATHPVPLARLPSLDPARAHQHSRSGTWNADHV